MRILNKMISSAILSAITISILSFYQPSPAQADIVSADECLPAVLILRGSGEQRIGDIDDKNTATVDDDVILDYKTYKKESLGSTYIKN